MAPDRSRNTEGETNGAHGLIKLPPGVCVCGAVGGIPYNRLIQQQNVTSVDDGARKSKNWLDEWQSGKLGTGSRV